MKQYPEHILLGALIVLALLVLGLAGCQGSRTLTIKTTPATSVNTRVDSSLVRAPTLAVLSHAGVHLSYPEKVRRYRDSLHVGARAAVVEIVLDHERMTVRTQGAETVHRLPIRGEEKTLRPDSVGFTEYVEGEPEAVVETIQLPGKTTRIDRLISLLKWMVVLVIAIGLVVGALRIVRWRQPRA